MPTLLASDIARSAAATIDEMAADAAGVGYREPAADQDRYARLWKQLCTGGWTHLAAPESRDGAGLALRDLTAVVTAWGRHLAPLPLVPTLLVRRWSAAELPPETPLSLALGRAGTSAPAPFAVGGTRCVRDLDAADPGSFGPGELTEAGWSRWAASLPVALAPCPSSGLDATRRCELLVLAGAELTGCAQALLATTVRHIGLRHQFGRPISAFQAVRHRLADMYRDVQLAESAVAWGAAEPDRAPSSTAIAWTNTQRAVDAAIQLHGGFGFTWEAGLHRYARHVSAWAQLLTACDVRLPH